MKQLVFTLLVALLATTAVSAQHPERKSKPGNYGEMTPEQMVEKRIEKMTRELNLTDEQQAKVREILTDEANYENQVRQMVMKRKKQNAEKIEQLLTPEQKAKRDELHKKGKGKPTDFDEGKDPAALSKADQKQCQANVKKCEANMKQCEANMQKCEANMKQCEANMQKCEANMKQCEANMQKCEANMQKCEANMKQCEANMQKCETNMKQCEAAKKDCCQGDKKECKAECKKQCEAAKKDCCQGDKKECKAECKKQCEAAKKDCCQGDKKECKEGKKQCEAAKKDCCKAECKK
ncbi:MAG: hypothetical protein ACI30R_04450 [Sodaliphilus sp.]